MSADLLRTAAARMRERAEAAEASGDGVAWYSVNEIHSALVGSTGPCVNTSDAEHIASWHPAVALAVADWLDRCVRLLADGRSCHGPEVASALAVARAYLGRDS